MKKSDEKTIKDLQEIEAHIRLMSECNNHLLNLIFRLSSTLDTVGQCSDDSQIKNICLQAINGIGTVLDSLPDGKIAKKEFNLIDEVKQGNVYIRLFKEDGTECDFTNYFVTKLLVTSKGDAYADWPNAGGYKDNHIVKARIFHKNGCIIEERHFSIKTNGSMVSLLIKLEDGYITKSHVGLMFGRAS